MERLTNYDYLLKFIKFIDDNYYISRNKTLI